MKIALACKKCDGDVFGVELTRALPGDPKGVAPGLEKGYHAPKGIQNGVLVCSACGHKIHVRIKIDG